MKESISLEAIASFVEGIEAGKAFPHDPFLDDEPLHESEMSTHRLYFDGQQFCEPKFWPEMELSERRVAHLYAKLKRQVDREYIETQIQREAEKVRGRARLSRPARTAALGSGRQRQNNSSKWQNPQQAESEAEPKDVASPLLLAIDLTWTLINLGAEIVRRDDGFAAAAGSYVISFNDPNLRQFVNFTTARIRKLCGNNDFKAFNICQQAVESVMAWPLPADVKTEVIL